MNEAGHRRISVALEDAQVNGIYENCVARETRRPLRHFGIEHPHLAFALEGWHSRKDRGEVAKSALLAEPPFSWR
jgi:hypothetical protein